MLTREILWSASRPTLGEFKSHIRITSTDLDGELRDKLNAAINAAENEIGQIIAPSRFTFSGKFSASVAVPGPVQAIESVTVDGEEVSAEDMDVEEFCIRFPESVSGSRTKIVFRAGPRGELAYDIRAAILLHAAALFNNPVDSVETLPKASTNLLRPYRRFVNGE